MERMDDLEEMLREMSEKYKNSKSVEVYEEQLEGWFKIIDDLREENKKLKSDYDRLDKVASENVKTLDELEAERIELEEENKELKEELKYYKEKTDFLNKVIVKYQEEK